MTRPRIGSLFSGTGALDLGILEVLDADLAWHVEYDEAPSKILEHHWPNVPNYGDVTAVDWTAVEPVEILTGGFPCQDLSLAGRRDGMRAGTRSGLWSDYLKAIATLRPQLVVIENVRGLLSGCAESDLEPCPGCVGDGEHRPVLRALGRVLGDLAALGYDTIRSGVRAADAGAPHNRFRVFVVAYPANVGHERPWDAWLRRSGLADDDRAPANDHRFGGREGNEPAELGAASSDRAGVPDERDAGRTRMVWGPYADAIERWERVLGRVVPRPTEPTGKLGEEQLSPAFCEWFMGYPNGWVTDPAIGISKNKQIKACGNGVVPQQAALALRALLGSLPHSSSSTEGKS